MDDSTIWKWFFNIAAIIGGGAWIGTVRSQVTRNEKDIADLQGRALSIAQVSERVARIEEQMRHQNTKLEHQNTKLDDIHRAVTQK